MWRSLGGGLQVAGATRPGSEPTREGWWLRVPPWKVVSSTEWPATATQYFHFLCLPGLTAVTFNFHSLELVRACGCMCEQACVCVHV